MLVPHTAASELHRSLLEGENNYIATCEWLLEGWRGGGGGDGDNKGDRRTRKDIRFGDKEGGGIKEGGPSENRKEWVIRDQEEWKERDGGKVRKWI